MTNSHRSDRRAWLGLAVLSLPCLLIAIDASVLNLAVPAISADLHPTGTELLWILDIYSFLLAGSLITMGRLGDRIGRRRLLLAGAGLFGAASVVAAWSPSPTMLIVARGALGIAGATLMPSTLALIRAMFPEGRQRATAIAVWGASLSFGGAVGPLIGGALLQLSTWHVVFLPGVPVMALLLVLGPRLLPEARDPNPGTLDAQSVTLSIAATLALVFALKRFAMNGPDARSLSAGLLGGAGAMLFVARQRRLTDPLLDLSLFRRRVFTVSLGANALGFALIAGTGLLVGQDLQLVRGLTPLQAGLWGTPAFAALIAGDLAAPALARRFAPAAVISGGLAIAAVGLVLLAGAARAGTGMIIVATTISSLGLAPVFNLAATQAVESAPESRAGAASALSETSTELGFALGIAALGAVATAFYRAGEHLPAARESLGAALHTGNAAIAASARHAFAHAVSATSALAAVMALVAAAAVVVVLTRQASARPAPCPA
jgi:MFS transporter, DHA2 family, multidrug resistance protein